MTNKGFSLIEVVFAVSIFAVVTVGIYQGFSVLTALVSASRDKVAAADLLNSEMEMVRNLSYSQVGLIGGIPNGLLQGTTTVMKDGRNFNIIRTIRNVDDPYDGQIGSTTNDLSPADYKLVEVRVICDNCKNPLDFSTISHVTPKGLETASTNGALFVRVFNASGDPVSQANVTIQNAALGVSINETTDNNGLLAVVDVPPAQNSYRIVATKSGFTTDRTYSTSTYPNPIKQDASVLLQQLTQISFVIDKTSNIKVNTITNICAPVSDVPFSANGTKLVATTPDTLKWSINSSTDSFGIKDITNVEWDIYSFTMGGGFYLAGTNPILPLSVLPDSDQKIDLVVSSETPSFLLVSVKDSVTGLPISLADVNLSASGFSRSLITNRGYLRQSDWSGGPGQLNFADPTMYHSGNNVDTNSPNGELKLSNSFGSYALSGEITSSIFDTGSSSNWSKIDILPTDQPVAAGVDPVKFQIATSPDNTATTTWNFLGPDGTSATFYTITNNNINPIHNEDRYIRYKLFLSTENNNFTPNISDLSISFSSSCIPPGQVLFSNLINQNYTLTVGAAGFATQVIDPININANWQKQEVLLSP